MVLPLIAVSGPVGLGLEVALVTAGVACALLSGSSGDQLKRQEKILFENIDVMLNDSNGNSILAWFSKTDQEIFSELKANQSLLVPSLVLLHSLDESSSLDDLLSVVDASASGGYLLESTKAIQSIQRMVLGEDSTPVANAADLAVLVQDVFGKNQGLFSKLRIELAGGNLADSAFGYGLLFSCFSRLNSVANEDRGRMAA